MANLITLSDYKSLLGVNPTNTAKDAQIEALIPSVSKAIQSYTDRRFDAQGGSVDRVFQYDGSGLLDIDDCISVVSVSTDAGYAGGPLYDLDPQEYTALPYRESADDDPHYYIQFNWFPGRYSGEMGFRRNLDTMDIVGGPVLVTVRATWGWPEVPADVKLAAAWTIHDSLNTPGNNDLRNESIEGFSRGWGLADSTANLALPARARDLLNNYIRVF